MNDLQPTIILGGGFVGLFTALHLSKQNYSERVMLVDRQERFVFKPLLYDYLTAEMNDSQVNPLYQELLEGSGVVFVRDTVRKIDPEKRRVELANKGNINYKYLVLALGAQTGYFGIEGAKEHTLPFRTRENAIALKNHLQECLKRSLSTENSSERQKLLTVATDFYLLLRKFLHLYYLSQAIAP
ncbi:NAD(P)/FAD-dependent oxidoreductase [Myxosarcina sp. GI1]|uniref:NAD(P)/FAD-dependent oxidoreductase n=1 Tax=Myxosarcina sp. GI1 TaxID=1541065 RepID=UPI00068A5861|nr:FAD-dependent oxidoreductase [Myxosarcina sp. GI1]